MLAAAPYGSDLKVLFADSAPTQDNAAEKAADVPQPGMLIIS